jgi:hypothetical protein
VSLPVTLSPGAAGVQIDVATLVATPVAVAADGSSLTVPSSLTVTLLPRGADSGGFVYIDIAPGASLPLTVRQGGSLVLQVDALGHPSTSVAGSTRPVVVDVTAFGLSVNEKVRYPSCIRCFLTAGDIGEARGDSCTSLHCT